MEKCLIRRMALMICLAASGLSACMKTSTTQAPVVVAGFTHQSHTYEVDGQPIHYVEIGDPAKPTVVFIHGSPGSWRAFEGFLRLERLLSQARLVAVDRPGFGLSGPGRPEPSLQRQAAALRPLLADSGGAILVGHSLGGPVAARLAMDYPELVAGLVLVAPSIDPDLERVYWYQRMAEWRLVSWLVPKSLRIANREILPLKAELEAMLPMWSSIRVPVTVIQGEKDRLVPAANADFAEERLTGAPVEVVRVPDMGHFVLWKKGTLTFEAIERHLTRLSDLSHPPG